jgi:hypothetical protein
MAAPRSEDAGQFRESCMPRKHPVMALAGLLLALLLGGCERQPAAAVDVGAATTRPAQAVRVLTAHLRDNDLAGFARDAVPPALHAQLESAWRAGHTRWPLDELPFDERLPSLLKALSTPGSDARLQQVFDRQFSGAKAELAAAAAALGLFGVQYVNREGDYSADERAHYAQLVTAISRWGVTAPLGDPHRASRAIPQLAAAARRTGLASEADFARLGMDASLQRLAPFSATLKRVLVEYGLALDASLADMQVTLLQQTGDSAQVRMQYPLAGSDIDTVVMLQRIDGRWYLGDYLRHARAAVAAAP